MPSTIALNPTGAELHNLEIADGRAQVRPGFALHYTLSSGRYVAAFTVINPRTSEPWHYLFSQATSDVVTLTVTDEEYRTVFTVDLGTMPREPVITWGIVNNQMMISSPSFSSTLYGVVGQGLIPALKRPSPDPLLTAIDVPTGHIAAWHDRYAIAQGNAVYINTGELDPRTFIGENALSFPAPVLDLFEGPDGALWVFTTRDAYVVPADALSQSQLVNPFFATIPGVGTSFPRNATTTNGTVIALAADGIVEVTTSAQKKADVSTYEGRRYLTPDVRVSDMRQCRIFPTTFGAIVSYRGAAPVNLIVDLRNGFRSFWWSRTTTGFDPRTVVGTLRTREGGTLLVLAPAPGGAESSAVYEVIGSRAPDFLSPVRGVACFRSALPADASPTARFVTVDADNVGQSTHVYLAGSASSVVTPTTADDCIVGTSTWSATVKLAERDKRTVRHAFAERIHDVEIEMAIDGAECTMDPGGVLFRGQATTRRSRS